MSAKYTPGPWYEVATGNHQGLIISETTSANVAVAYDKKDAALIASAPELFHELLQCADVLEQLADDAEEAGYPNRANTARELARESKNILHKAEGK